MNGPSPNPGERWLANWQPVDQSAHSWQEIFVTLVDFDARTETWTVQRDGSQESIALLAKDLIRRLD
jgi:hypothetical protein